MTSQKDVTFKNYAKVHISVTYTTQSILYQKKLNLHRGLSFLKLIKGLFHISFLANLIGKNYPKNFWELKKNLLFKSGI